MAGVVPNAGGIMLFLRHAAVALGLAIVLPLLAFYGLRTVTPEPDHTAYFADVGPMPSRLADHEVCGHPQADPEACITPAERTARKAAFEKADAERDAALAQATARYEAAKAAFAERLFLTATPLGLLAIVAAGLIRSATVGTGLILGGLGSITLGYFGYWDHMPDAWRFVSLLAALAVLLWLGWRKLLPPEPASDPGGRTG